MPTALGPRFVLETGFLLLLALVVGLADLDPSLIVLVMLVGWILVSLIEYFGWRQSQAAVMRGFQPAPAAPAVDEMVVDTPPPPPPPPPPAPPPPPPPEEGTAVTPPSPEDPPEGKAAENPAQEEPAPSEAKGATAFANAEERRVAHRLEPLQPRPRRRWIFFGPYERRGQQAEDDSEA